MINSNIIIYVAPAYVWGFTYQMKALLDRQSSLVKFNESPIIYLLKGKITALLTSCAGSNEHNSDLIKEIFSRKMSYLQCKVDFFKSWWYKEDITHISFLHMDSVEYICKKYGFEFKNTDFKSKIILKNIFQ